MAFTCLLVNWLSVTPSLQDHPTPAIPLDPIEAILDAFETHNIVALGEGDHGNEQGHAFRLQLIRNPRFAATVNDIVVEFGNSRYQEVVDRFVTGVDVTARRLHQVWQNTTQPHPVWDRPIYEEFLRAVRDVNASLPPARQLRVLLGDPPIQWEQVRGHADIWTWGDRDGYPTDIIRRDVLAKGRRGLVIYGDMHLLRRSPRHNYQETELARGIVIALERDPGMPVFSIWTATRADLREVQPSVSSWSAPALAHLRGTVLGAKDFTFYRGFPESHRFLVRNGEEVALPRSRWQVLPMEEQFDAVLYLGPPSAITQSTLSPEWCADEDYMEMRLGRMALVGMHSGVDRLREYCASAGRGERSR